MRERARERERVTHAHGHTHYIYVCVCARARVCMCVCASARLHFEYREVAILFYLYIPGLKRLTFRNGADRCGLFCALGLSLEKMNTEHEIDVFNAVKRVRISRPEFIINEVGQNVEDFWHMSCRYNKCEARSWLC